jgi:DNA-binding FadR family transcriptional regulator
MAMERSRTNQARLEADVAFHECIFRASGNRICHLLFNVIHRTVLTSMNQLSHRVTVDRPLAFDKRIYTAIRDRDPQEARRNMLEHIMDAQALLATPAKAEKS